MSELDISRLISPRKVAFVLGRNIQKLRELRKTDETFPRPVKIGRRHMYVESEFLSWYGETLSSRRID